MRLTVARLRRVVKADLPIEFVPQPLTSYGGLELLRRYFGLLGLHCRIRQAFSGYGLGGDYGAGRLVFLVIALSVVGARRLEHLRYRSSRCSLAAQGMRDGPSEPAGRAGSKPPAAAPVKSRGGECGRKRRGVTASGRAQRDEQR